MLIREKEFIIIQKLTSNETYNFKAMAADLNLSYHTLSSIVNRLLTYSVIHKSDKGTFSLKTQDYTIASDKEVINFRRSKSERLLELIDPAPLIVGEDLEELKDFIREQCKGDVPRSKILNRINRSGYDLTRHEFVQFIEFHSLAPKRKKTKDIDIDVA